MVRNSNGFSLIEALVSMSITILIIMSIFSLFPRVRRGLQSSENRANAAFLGSSLIADLRSRDFASIASSSGSYTCTGKDNNAAFALTIRYTITITVVDVDKKQVWIRLRWNESGGAKELSMDTVMVKL